METLFRGKLKTDNGNLKKGDWVTGDYVRLKDGNHTIHCIYGKGEVDADTVGQYIGLPDKNGKDIFIGDIVEDKSYDFIFVVKFGKCGGINNTENYGYMGFYLEAYDENTKICAKYGLRNDICYFTDIEVIGNIHDNPELFEEGAASDA